MTRATRTIEPRDGAEVVLRLEEVCVDRGETRVLENITLTVHAGAFVGLVGPNGAGKTTLLKTMLGLIEASAGSIEIMGRPPSASGGAPSGVGGIGHAFCISLARPTPYFPQRRAIPRLAGI